MADISALNRRLDEIARRLRENVGELLGTIVEEVGRDLVPATPVRTGFARANWRPSIGAPAPTPVSFLDPTGSATIGRITTVARRVRVGDTVYLVNRTPYIGELNEGKSPQAPAGFIQQSARDGFRRGVERFSGRLLD